MEKKRIYFLAIFEDPQGGFTSSFPDFDCLVDQGETFEEVLSRSQSLLDFVLKDFVEHNKKLPPASNLTQIKTLLPKCSQAVLVPVTAYIPQKTERINITSKGDIIARIDDYAKQHHLTRSELMINATLEYISAR